MQQYRGRMDDTSAIPWKGSSEFVPNTLDNLRVRSQSGVWVFNLFRPDNCGQRDAVSAKRTRQIGQNDTVPWDVYVHVPVVSDSQLHTAAPRTSATTDARDPIRLTLAGAALPIVSALGEPWE